VAKAQQHKSRSEGEKRRLGERENKNPWKSVKSVVKKRIIKKKKNYTEIRRDTEGQREK
jgi:hypothetical protein